jgi:3alpha(or 20beta)-hydroxysteroid dehydrogenase
MSSNHEAVLARTALTGKVAVVTGGAHGMGAEHVRTLTARGASVLFTDLDERSGSELSAELSAAGGTATFVAGDVRDSSAWATWRDAAMDRFGGVHALINNAGVFGEETIAPATLSGTEEVMAVSMKPGWMLLTRMPQRPNSCAPVFVRPRTPHLLAV